MPFKSGAQSRFFAGCLPEKTAGVRRLVAEMSKSGAFRSRPRPRSALRWIGKEIVTPALPTAVLAVLANEAIRGADSLRTRLASRAEEVLEKRKERKRNA